MTLQKLANRRRHDLIYCGVV